MELNSRDYVLGFTEGAVNIIQVLALKSRRILTVIHLPVPCKTSLCSHFNISVGFRRARITADKTSKSK